MQSLEPAFGKESIMKISIFTRRFISVILSICLLMTTVFIAGYRETVSAATTDVPLTVESGQNWTRPNIGPGWPFTTVTAGTNSNYHYTVYPFAPSVSGNYSISTTGGDLYDKMFYVYSGAFSAASPLANFLIGDDDAGGGSSGLDPLIASVPLTSGTTYYLVVTSSVTFKTGTVNVQFNGPGAINSFILNYAAGVNGTLTGTTPQTVTFGGFGIAVTGVPNIGYHFNGWSDGVLTSTRTDTNVRAPHTYTANFAINTYALSYSAGSNGTLTGTASLIVNHGGNGTLVTAVPDVGYYFVNWSDGSPSAARTDLDVQDAIAVTANFAINSYTLTYAAGPNGTLSDSAAQTVDYGYDGTAVTAIPDSGYHFTSWSDGVLTAVRTDLGVKTNLSVTANFAINSYSVIFQDWDGSVLSEQIVIYGTDAISPANPVRSGYTFTSWSLPFTSVTGNIITVAGYSQNPAPTATPTPTPTPAPTAVPTTGVLGAAKTGELDNQNMIIAAVILLAAFGVAGTVLILRRKR